MSLQTYRPQRHGKNKVRSNGYTITLRKTDLRKTKMQNLAKYLFDHKAKNLPAIALAEVFDRLIWVLDDDDKQIMETIETWLLGNDGEKIEIALLMNEIFPFENRLQMENVLNRIANDFPQRPTIAIN